MSAARDDLAARGERIHCITYRQIRALLAAMQAWNAKLAALEVTK